MSPKDRHAMFVRRIGAILDLPRDQIVTFTHEAISSWGVPMPVEVTVDGRNGRAIVVAVPHPSPWQGEMLRGDEFVSGGEQDDYSMAYRRDVAGATPEQIADLVEWVFVCAFEAPLSYAPRVRLYGNWARLIRKPAGPFAYIIVALVVAGLFVTIFFSVGYLWFGHYPWSP